ncbi:MFS transporter, partial [Chloroflexota bacterium]
KLTVIGILIFATGYIAMHWMNSLVMFFILYAGFIALGYQAGFYRAAVVLANKWFIRHRSKATGTVSVIYALGGVVLVPVLGWVIIQYGWRIAAVIAGTATLLIGLPLSLFIRNLPEDKGLLPDGEEVETKQATEEPSEASREVAFTVREAIKTRAFWILAAAFVLRGFVVQAIWVHMVPLLVFKGFDEQGAANAIGLLLIFTLPSRFTFGWLGDIYPKRYLLMFACLIETFALIIVLTAQSMWQVYLFVIVFALGYGVAPLDMAIVGDYFGRKNFATIQGIRAPVTALGVMAGPIYAGYIYDVTQSYEIVFITFMALYFLAAIVFIFARRPKPPARAVSYTPS